MKVLIVSDTHKNIRNVQKVLDKTIPFGVKYLIHCGDHITDALEIERLYPEIIVYGVPGNCDFSSYGKDRECVVEIEGITFFITHGDRHGVKWDYEELYTDASVYDASIAVCGHTHIAHKEKKEGMFLLNPGSISQPRDTTIPPYAVVEIEKGKIQNIAIMQWSGETPLPHPYF